MTDFRTVCRTLIAFLALWIATVAAAADSYDPSTRQLTVPSLTLGNATYTNLVATVSGVLTVEGGATDDSADFYDPANGVLVVPTVTSGQQTYTNVLATVDGLVSIGSVSGADSYDGAHLTIPSVQLGLSVYTNVVITVARVMTVAGGMPGLPWDLYTPSTNQLTIPAVVFQGKVYTNVTIEVGTVETVGGHAPTLTLTTTRTTPSIDGALPYSVVQSVAQIVSSADGEPFGSALVIPAGATGFASPIFALDAQQNLLLAAYADSPTTTLSADSTAVALVLLSIGTLPSPRPPFSQLAQAIQATSGYPALVTALNAAFANHTPPLQSVPVAQAVATVAGQSELAIATPLFPNPAGARSSRTHGASSTPVTANPPLPFQILGLAASRPTFASVYLSNANATGVSLVNSMPIAWSAASVDSHGNPIDPNPTGSGLLLPGTNPFVAILSSPAPVLVGGNDQQFTVEIAQTADTRTRNLQIATAELASVLVEQLADLAGAHLPNLSRCQQVAAGKMLATIGTGPLSAVIDAPDGATAGARFAALLTSQIIYQGVKAELLCALPNLAVNTALANLPTWLLPGGAVYKGINSVVDLSSGIGAATDFGLALYYWTGYQAATVCQASGSVVYCNPFSLDPAGVAIRLDLTDISGNGSSTQSCSAPCPQIPAAGGSFSGTATVTDPAGSGETFSSTLQGTVTLATVANATFSAVANWSATAGPFEGDFNGAFNFTIAVPYTVVASCTDTSANDLGLAPPPQPCIFNVCASCNNAAVQFNINGAAGPVSPALDVQSGEFTYTLPAGHYTLVWQLIGGTGSGCCIGAPDQGTGPTATAALSLSAAFQPIVQVGPAVTLTANPVSVTSGNSSTLSWNSPAAVSCTAPWTSSTAASGSASTGPLTTTTTYSITCTDANGVTSDPVSVTVPVTGIFNASFTYQGTLIEGSGSVQSGTGQFVYDTTNNVLSAFSLTITNESTSFPNEFIYSLADVTSFTWNQVTGALNLSTTAVNGTNEIYYPQSFSVAPQYGNNVGTTATADSVQTSGPVTITILL